VYPQVLHQSQPSLRISVWLPHSGHLAPCITGAKTVVGLVWVRCLLEAAV